MLGSDPDEHNRPIIHQFYRFGLATWVFVPCESAVPTDITKLGGHTAHYIGEVGAVDGNDLTRRLGHTRGRGSCNAEL